MTVSFFCYECGEIIEKYNFDKVQEKIVDGVECTFCGAQKRLKYCYYPHFSVNDFIKTIRELYEQNKDDLTKKLTSSYKIFNKIEDTHESLSLEDYTTIYHVLDSLLENEVEYSIDVKSRVFDNLEDKLVQLYPTDLAISIVSSLPLINTLYRKPIVILIASTIELLFNIYYEDACTIQDIPAPNKKFLPIPRKIAHLDSNRNTSLEQIMKQYDESFYNSWSDLRTIRNKVIHKNSLYISNKMIEDYMNLLELSITVFINITSDLYRDNYASKNNASNKQGQVNQ
ncbi:hypothetical protein CN564_18110 [Bacillus pseudomycoides]|nr:hypothetical protein CN564_18110 [Bacillus pseudomycoides]